MTNQTRGFIRRSILAVITMGILLFPTMVVQAKTKTPNTPQAVWWDEKSDKAGVARCNEVEYADEYTFLLYRNGKQIASKTSKDNHCDLAKEMENYCYTSKNTSVYFTVEVSSKKAHVHANQSNASDDFTARMWSDLIEYLRNKK